MTDARARSRTRSWDGAREGSTAEIGPILIRKLEKVRNTTRVEFLCGFRAIRRARADFEALSKIAQVFSAPLDQTPHVAVTHVDEACAGEKLRRKLKTELGRYQGRELYESTTPDAAGFRRAFKTVASGNLDELRTLANSFTEQPKAIFVGVLREPPSLLLAVSEDSGADAAKLMKSSLAEAGGRGGGNSRLAQGSVARPDLLEAVISRLLSC